MSLIEKLKIELLNPVEAELIKERYGENVLEELRKNEGFSFVGERFVQSFLGMNLSPSKDYYAILGVKPGNDEELKYMIKRLGRYASKNQEIAEAIDVLSKESSRERYNASLLRLQTYFLEQVKLDSFRFLALGGAGEVGRSSYYVKVGKGNYFLLDLGMQPSTGFPPFYELLRLLPRVKAVFISHAHLDHYGLLSRLKLKGLKEYLGDPLPPIIASEETKLQISMSLDDLVNKGLLTEDEKKEIVDSIQENKTGYGNIGSVYYRLIDSGHIRGSKMVLLEADGDSVLYTGDINFEDNEILRGARPISEKVNTLITEATYAGVKKKEDYEKRKSQLIEIVDGSIQEGFNVLIPAFSIQRAELVLRILNDGINRGKIRTRDKIIAYGLGARFAKEFGEDVLNNVDFSFLDEKSAASEIKELYWSEKGRIFVTGSGDLSKGLSSQLLLDSLSRSDRAVVIVGYQPPGSLGSVLLRGKETGSVQIGDSVIKLKCRIYKVDLGAHASEEHIFDFIEKVSPKNLIVIHSDDPEAFSEDLKSSYGIRAVTPTNLQVVFDYGAFGLSWLPKVEEGKKLYYCECGLVFKDYESAMRHFKEAGHMGVYPYRVYSLKILKAEGAQKELIKQEVERAKNELEGALKEKGKIYGLYYSGDMISVVMDSIDEDDLLETVKELNKNFESIALVYFKRPNEVIYESETYKFLFEFVKQEFVEKFGVEPFISPLLELYNPADVKDRGEADGFFKPETKKIYVSKTLTGHELLLKELLAHELAHYYQDKFSEESVEVKAELRKKRDLNYMQWTEGFAEFVPYYLNFKSEYRPIIYEPHKETFYLIGLEKYKAIYDVFGMKGVMKAALSLRAFKELSRRAFERLATSRSSEKALLFLKKAGVYKKILLKKGFDPLSYLSAWNIDKDYVSLKKIREKKKYFSLSNIKKEMVSKAIAYGLLRASRAGKASDDEEVLEMVSDLIRNRLNQIYILKKGSIYGSMEINEYVFGFDLASTKELLKEMGKGSKVKFSVLEDGKIHYKLAEDKLGLGRSIAKYYLDKMADAKVLSKAYIGMLMGCRVHRRYDPMLRLVCPSCGSPQIRSFGEKAFKCDSCGQTFEAPRVQYFCREEHAFDFESSERSEVYEYSITSIAKKRLEI